jgi:hypothetical protein
VRQRGERRTHATGQYGNGSVSGSSSFGSVGGVSS